MLTLLHRLRSDRGFTLVAVMGTMAILTVFLLASLGFAITNMAPNRKDQDSKAAMAAAQAGIDDFVSRLNGNDSYWVNNSSDKFAASGDTSNAAFAATGVSIPGTASGPVTYHYSVLSASTATTQSGIIRLQSTGKSRNASRTLLAQLQPSGFLRYIYFTDIEAQDPALWDTSRADCSRYYYAVPPTPARDTTNSDPSKRCVEIQFASGDEIKGPLHSNDALQINGSALFTDPKTESSWADGASPAPAANHRWWGSGTPDSAGYKPIYQSPVVLPAANSEIQNYVDPAKDDTEAPGCLYTGQTRIRFAGNQMYVLSPGTISSTTKARCYNYRTPSVEQVLSIPPVIYVQQRTGACSTPANFGYPMAGENSTYRCSDGDAFLQGTVTGQVTIGTSNDIVVTGNLKTTTNNLTGSDVIGLVALNYVWVYHPVQCIYPSCEGTDPRSWASVYRNLLPAATTPYEIDAAILAVAHSFVVQEWGKGSSLSNGSDSTKLTVKGAHAQKYRGPVGTGYSDGTIASGYLKNYIYDPRLMTLPPPYFLKPVSAPWGVSKLSE